MALVARAGFAATDDVRAFTSLDGHVRLQYPAWLVPARRTVVGNYFVARGWRVFWGGNDTSDGRVIVSFTTAARPAQQHASARESLQIGVSRDPRAVATCSDAGLPADAGGRRLAPRTIGGVTYRVFTRGDQAMSQGTTTVDLRAVVGDACYAIDRISDSANSDAPANVTLPQARAAAILDAIVRSVRITP